MDLYDELNEKASRRPKKAPVAAPRDVTATKPGRSPRLRAPVDARKMFDSEIESAVTGWEPEIDVVSDEEMAALNKKFGVPSRPVAALRAYNKNKRRP